MNFKKYFEMPTDVVQLLVDHYQITDINPKVYHTGLIHLEKHSFETEDSIVDFGQTSFEGDFFQVSKIFTYL